MIYITASNANNRKITLEVEDAKLVERILVALIEQGYDMFIVKGWAAE